MTLGCCPINVTEVYAGLRRKEEARYRSFLASLQYYPITLPAVRLARELKRERGRKGATLNLGDVIIAAVAIHNQLTLLTDNVKDFRMEVSAPSPKGMTTSSAMGYETKKTEHSGAKHCNGAYWGPKQDL